MRRSWTFVPAKRERMIENRALDTRSFGSRRSPRLAERFDGVQDRDVAAAVG
jgi:hypothetical protein